MRNINHCEILIIGAGAAGLHLGQRLNTLGKPAVILEKSRGIGGRLATRRIENLGFDHGIPYLPNTALMSHLLELYSIEEIVKKNQKGLMLMGGMNQLAKSMAHNLDIRRNIKATKIWFENLSWMIETENNETFIAPILVIATPLTQAQDLLKTCSSIELDYPQVSYSKQILSLNILEDGFPIPSEVEMDGFKLIPQVERGLHPRGIIFYGSDEFSEINFDKDENEIIELLHIEIEKKLGTKIPVRMRELKKWRYSVPHTRVNSAFMRPEKSLFIIGDYFADTGIESAFLSAEAIFPQIFRQSR